jgi:hypothetical protein
MRKIRLDLGTLAVESFDTSRLKEEARGTVEAHSGRPCTPPNTNLCPTNLGYTCDGFPDTCVLSCPGNFCCATEGAFSCP